MTDPTTIGALLRRISVDPPSGSTSDPAAELEREHDVAELVRLLRSGVALPAPGVRAGLTLWGSDRLLTFAVHRAGAAATQRSLELLRDGLVAFAFEGGNRDPRDSGFALWPLADAARTIGADTRAEFDDAARFAPPDYAPRMRDYVRHPVLDWVNRLWPGRARLAFRREEPNGTIRYVTARPYSDEEMERFRALGRSVSDRARGGL